MDFKEHILYEEIGDLLIAIGPKSFSEAFQVQTKNSESENTQMKQWWNGLLDPRHKVDKTKRIIGSLSDYIGREGIQGKDGSDLSSLLRNLNAKLSELKAKMPDPNEVGHQLPRMSFQ